MQGSYRTSLPPNFLQKQEHILRESALAAIVDAERRFSLSSGSACLRATPTTKTRRRHIWRSTSADTLHHLSAYAIKKTCCFMATLALLSRASKARRTHLEERRGTDDLEEDSNEKPKCARKNPSREIKQSEERGSPELPLSCLESFFPLRQRTGLPTASRETEPQLLAWASTGLLLPMLASMLSLARFARLLPRPLCLLWLTLLWLTALLRAIFLIAIHWEPLWGYFSPLIKSTEKPAELLRSSGLSSARTR